MQTLRLFVAIAVVSAGTSTLCAQTSPADHEKMLELLRQKVAEERAKTSPPAEAVSNQQPAPAAPAAPQITSSEHDKMLEVLRQKMAEERAKTPAETRSLRTGRLEMPAPKPENAEARTPAPATGPTETAESPTLQSALEVLRAAVAKERAAETPSAAVNPRGMKLPAKETPIARAAEPAREIAPSVPATEKPAGPKTKQERLDELLLQYKADQITPREYHEQRAKILTEP